MPLPNESVPKDFSELRSPVCSKILKRVEEKQIF